LIVQLGQTSTALGPDALVFATQREFIKSRRFARVKGIGLRQGFLGGENRDERRRR
jgi:hypothetical protein